MLHALTSGRMRRVVGLVMATGLVLSVASSAGAANPMADKDTIIKGCVDYKTKVMTISIYASTKFCGEGKSYRWWNVEGPRGEQGAKGAPGAQGPVGAKGATGAT